MCMCVCVCVCVCVWIANDVPFKRIGKLIVAQNEREEAEKLQEIWSRAEETRRMYARRFNEHADMELRMLTKEEAKALEPELQCSRAIWSPMTGIVDTHTLMETMRAEVEDLGGAVVTRRRVIGGIAGTGAQSAPHHLLRVADVDGAVTEIECDEVINAAGLGARALLDTIENAECSWDVIPKVRFAKGNYFSLAKSSAPFRRLVYPLPEPGGLGVHLTLDMGGRTRFGPDVEWLDDCNTKEIEEASSSLSMYAVDQRRAEAFYASIRRYWPSLVDGALVADYSGLRPKLMYPKSTAQQQHDFWIEPLRLSTGDVASSFINAMGIESPGITSSMAIAEYVEELLLSSTTARRVVVAR